jgi:hypothetical protein
VEVGLVVVWREERWRRWWSGGGEVVEGEERLLKVKRGY